MKIIGWIFGILGAALLGYLFFGSPITVTVPEAKVQEEVQKRLPMDITKSGVTMHIDTLEIDFLEGDLVDVVLGMDLDGYSFTGRAEGNTQSSLRYDAGNFYLENLSLDNLKVTATQDSAEKIDELTEAANGLWNRFKGEGTEDADTASALDSLKDRAIAKLLPKAEEMANAKLQEIPVYSLNDKDMKMDLAAMALEDVTFTADGAEVTLDPRNVILWGIGWALIAGFSVLLAIGMIRSGTILPFV